MSTTTIDLEHLKARCVKGEKRTARASVQWNPEQRDGSELRVSGHAAVFESESEDLGFIETLAPGCFERALSRPGADPYLLLGHDKNAILARRSAGTLELREDEHGLAFTANIVPTTQGRDVALLVKSGHLDGCSFGFTVEKDSWSERGGQAYRRVTEIGELFEITLTGNPAYPAASVRDRELTKRIERTVARARQARNTTPAPYAIDGPHSWVRDTLVVSEAKRAWDQAFAAGRGPVLPKDGHLDTSVPNPQHGSLAEARQRLAQLDKHLAETRDISTTATAGGGFAAAPQHVADAFAASVTSIGVLPSIFPQIPLPTVGMSWNAPRITTGASVARIATENSTAPAEQDIVESKIANPITTIAGMIDLSYALLERSEPGMDVVIATELGLKIAENIDQLLLTGSGTPPYAFGLGSVAGITATTWTTGTPTATALLTKIGESAAALATALGRTPTHVLMHPRRLAWFETALASTMPLVANPIPFGMKLVSVSAIATNTGAGTNQDTTFLICNEELPIGFSPVRFDVMLEPGSGTLTARCRAHQFVGTLFTRRPEAISTITGTGLTSPTFP